MKMFISFLGRAVLVLFVMSCNSNTPSDSKESTANKTSSENESQTSNTSVNWNDSISKEVVKDLTPDKNGVEVYAVGEKFDNVLFRRNNQTIGVDRIMNGNYLGVRGGNGTFEKVWTGTDWSNCTLYPCTGMDIWTVPLENDVTYVSVRHGNERDLVYCYAVLGDKVHRSKEWRDFGPGNLEHGVKVSREGNQYKIEGFGSSNGFIIYNVKTDSYSYRSSNDNILWSPESNRQEQILPKN